MSVKQIILFGFILILALFASACGGGAGEQIASKLPNDNTPGHSIGDSKTDDSGGIGGSGRTADFIGPITAIDNTITVKGTTITVKGIEWDFSEEDLWFAHWIPESHQSLKVGMVVYVYGNANPDEATGEAIAIYVEPSLIGSIETIDEDTIMILGQQVVVTDQTIFDPDNVSPPSMSGLKVGEDIIVYGQMASEDTIQASLIQKLATPPTTKVVSGLVVSVEPDRIQVGSLVIDSSIFRWGFYGDIEYHIGDHIIAMGRLYEDSLFYSFQVFKTEYSIEENEYLDIDGLTYYGSYPVDMLITNIGVIKFAIDDQTQLYDSLTPDDFSLSREIRIKGVFKNDFLHAEEIYRKP